MMMNINHHGAVREAASPGGYPLVNLKDILRGYLCLGDL